MPIHRATVLFLLANLLAARADSADANTGPARLPASRYAAMGENSPFALATPPAPASVPQGSFAANWFVGGMGRLGDTDFVTIKSRDLSVQFTLFGAEIHEQHRVSVASVNWSNEIGQSTVILQKGTETAKLEFNQALLRPAQPIAGAPQSPTPAAPNAAANPANPLPAATKAVTMPPLPMNGGRPGIVPAPAGRQYPTASHNSGIVQRRVQIIAQPK